MKPCCENPEPWFDRVVCAEPCGWMHYYCLNCGALIGFCAHYPSSDERED